METLDKKEIDKNDYWLIPDNPITKIGVFPYLGRQISPELEPDTIYQVLRPEEELTKPETLKSFELIPLVDDHTMLGTKDENHTPAEQKGIHGVTGTNVKQNGDIITVDLKIYSETLKEEIENGKKDLSLGYYSSYELIKGLYKGQAYDAVQRNIIANHIALVDEGRMGRDVRVMDSNITFDSITDLRTKNIGEQTNMENQEEKQTTQDVDKREIIREVMAIAAKPAEDFEGGEEEKIETIAKKLEAISYNPSETGANDEDDADKPAEVEIKEDKPAEDEDDDKPAKEEEDKPSEDDDKEEGKPVSMDEAIKYIAKRDDLIAKVKPLIGDNTKYGSMNINEVVKYACDKLDIKPTLDTLEGYIKANSRQQAKITLAQDSMIKSYDKKSQVIRDYLK